jgi:hypothetical protein
MGIEKIGKVIKLIAFPCAAPPQIWVTCAIPALLYLFYSLAPTDKKSLVKIATGKSWLKILHQYVEESEAVNSEFSSSALEYMFEVTEFADAAAWYFFLAELGSDFLFNWTSLVYARAGCSPIDQTETLSGNEQVGGIVCGADWGNDSHWTETNPSPGNAISGPFNLPAGGRGVIAISTTAIPNTGVSTAVSVRFIETTTGNVVASATEPASEGVSPVTVIMSQVIINSSGFAQQYNVQYQCPAGAPLETMGIIDGTITWYTGTTNPYF